MSRSVGAAPSHCARRRCSESSCTLVHFGSCVPAARTLLRARSLPTLLVFVHLLGILFPTLLFSQIETIQPVWTISGPTEPVRSGQPFAVTAEVRLPAGYYQDADSAFLEFEPQGPATVVSRSSSAPSLRSGKDSFTGVFTLTRTLVLPESASSPFELTMKLGWQICQVDGVCLLPVEQTRKSAVVLAGAPVPAWESWVAAFLGGLLLNLMPCVFPVLALKGLGLAASARGARAQRRREALAFAGGTFTTVFVLGLATTAFASLGQRLDWGFPFQQPVFVGLLALCFAGLTLQLAGWWRWNGSPFSLSVPAKAGLARSWWGGAFIVLTAAPCTAPILGPALGYALSRPAVEIPVFFAFIGLGLAAPLLVLHVFPNWAKLLPPPGRWMLVVEKIAAVFLAATTAYLLWILTTQTGWERAAGAAALMGAGFLLLLLKKRNLRLKRILAVMIFVAGLAALIVTSPPSADLRGWSAYSPQALESALVEGRPVLVDATATWCATCQVNEWAVLDRPDVEALLDRLGVVRLRADYTNPDPVIHQWLNSVKRAGLPVYALYRPGRDVYLFPELLSDQNFTDVLPRLVP